MLDFPGYGWTAEHTITYRDANIDDDEFVEQYFGMFQAKTFDEFQQVHEEANGIPLFNTIATSADGRAWYADASATPTSLTPVSPGTRPRWRRTRSSRSRLTTGPCCSTGRTRPSNGSRNRAPRDPGLVPPADQRPVERSDYVFNANDSFWVPDADHLLTGDYSPLHGRQRTARSARTRETPSCWATPRRRRASGDDGFTLH